ncbi:MAG: DUF6527 family protein [Ginsengibacter sp.]
MLTTTFYPSIGNWSFDCQSHYWIRENMIVTIPETKRGAIKEINIKKVMKTGRRKNRKSKKSR